MKRKLLATLVLATLLGACASPPTMMVTEALILKNGIDKAKFIKQVEHAKSKYEQDHAASPCLFGEDTIIPGLVQYIERRGPAGVKESLERLEDIARDETLSGQVRSHALYHQAVIWLRREPRKRSPEKALELFKEIYLKYPGTHDCVIADTPWRRRMEEKLNIHVPEELNKLIDIKPIEAD